MRKAVICIVFTIFFLTGCGTDYMVEANELLEERDFVGAAASFEQAAEQVRDDAEKTDKLADALRGLAICLYEQNDFQSARDTFQQVLDNGGEATPEMYNLMAISAMHLNDYTGGAELFQTGITLAGVQSGTDTAPEEYASLVQEMRFNEIVCYEKVQDWENAKVKMLDYASLYPDDQEAQKESDFLGTR